MTENDKNMVRTLHQAESMTEGNRKHQISNIYEF